MKHVEPVWEARIEAFLKNMLVDSEDYGENDGKFTRWTRMKLDDSDLVIRAYQEDPEHPFQQDPGGHGPAYAAAMEAMILLRHWWFESIDYTGALPHAEALTSMANDASAVAEIIENHAKTLRVMAELPQPAEAERLNASLRDAQKDLVNHERKMRELRALVECHEARQALHSILTEGPVEQLARVAENNNQDEE